MSKILVGFDGGEESRDALWLARAFAVVEDAALEVAVAVDDPPLPLPDEAGDAALGERFERVFEAAEATLEGTPFIRRTLRGASAPHALTDLAEDEEVELIVVGSTHRGTLGRVYPGGVAERLLSGAPCPIAVAPRGYAGHPHAGFGLIGVGFDGNPEAREAVRVAERWALRLDALLRLITVIPPLVTLPPPVGRTDLGYGALVREHYEAISRRGGSLVDDEVEAEPRLTEGDPAAALAEQGVELDLLVLGSRGYGPLRRTLLGGVSADVMRSAPCPVIVVPRGAERDAG